MRKKLYDFIKSPAGGKSKTTVYDYFMMIVIIVRPLKPKSAEGFRFTAGGYSLPG